MEQTVDRFGGIDIAINNASAINLAGTEALEMKRYDLMQDINTRGTFVVSKHCVPHLRQAENPHVLTLSPPLSLDPKWVKNHVGYTLAKYGMSFCTLGMAEEFRDDGIAFNSLWPRTLVATAAVQNLLGGDEAMAKSRKPEVVADSAYAVLNRPSRECTGNFFLCEDVLAEEGVTDLEPVLVRRRRGPAGRPVRRAMKAIQVKEFGGPEVLELGEVDEPEAPEGAELVEVSAAGINYADTHQAENSLPGRGVAADGPGRRGGRARLPDGRRVVALVPGRRLRRAGGGLPGRLLAGARRRGRRSGAGAGPPGHHRLAPAAHQRAAARGRERGGARRRRRGGHPGDPAGQAVRRGPGDRRGLVGGEALAGRAAGRRRRGRLRRPTT